MTTAIYITIAMILSVVALLIWGLCRAAPNGHGATEKE